VYDGGVTGLLGTNAPTGKIAVDDLTSCVAASATGTTIRATSSTSTTA
jgi:hypothetical protein